MADHGTHAGHHRVVDGHAQTRTVRDTAVPQGVIYTCPMHPQIWQVGPGNCPICGMTLEPEVAIVETGPSAELVDMTRRFWIGLVLAVPVLVLEMGGTSPISTCCSARSSRTGFSSCWQHP